MNSDDPRSGDPEHVARARGLVDALVGAYADEHAAHLRQVELIAALCAEYSALDAAQPAVPGAERLVPAGHDGTPDITEHLATELAPQLRRTILSTAILISQTMDLLHRHPRVWHACQAGRLPVWQARHIAAATGAAELSREAADWVDEKIAPACGHLAWGRLKTKLAGLIVRADPHLAAQQAEKARQERFVRVRQYGDGTAFVLARTDAADAHHLWHTLNQVADQLAHAGDTHEIDVRRATALGVLADPDAARTLLAGPEPDPHDPTTNTPGTKPSKRRRRRPRKSADLVIHLAPGCVLGRCDQLGPALEHQIRDWLGHTHVTVHPVIDLTDDPAVDSYEIPDAIARIVCWRNPYDLFPWSTQPSAGLDQDHTTTFDHSPDAPPGQTRPNNLGPVNRRFHRAKTHSGWHLTQPAPGIYDLYSRLGYHYRTDHTGSHEIPTHPPTNTNASSSGSGPPT